MGTAPRRQSASTTTGVVRIVRQVRQGDPARPFDYLVSFGGSKAPYGAVHIGKAFGTRDLIRLLTQGLGVAGAAAEMAAQALTDYPVYEITDVTLRRGQLHRLTK